MTIKEIRSEIEALLAKETRSDADNARLAELTKRATQARADEEARAALAALDAPTDTRKGDHAPKRDAEGDGAADARTDPAPAATETRADGGDAEKRDLFPGRAATMSGDPLPGVASTSGHAGWHRAPEVREFARLALRARPSRFLTNAADDVGDRLDGADKELRDAVNGEREKMPWAAIVDREFLDGMAEGRSIEDLDDRISLDSIIPPEERAAGDTATSPADGNIARTQNAIVGRVFAPSITNYLGIRVQPVGVGKHMWPVITAGVEAAWENKGDTNSAPAATITPKEVEPHDLAAAYLFHMRDQALLKGYEAALRADLSRAMMDQLDKSILRGGASPNLAGGLLNSITGVDVGETTGAATWAKWVAIYTGAWDGLYTRSPGEVRVLMAPGGAASAESLVQSNTAVTAYEQIQRRTGGVRFSEHMPGKANNKWASLVVKTGVMGNAVAAVWNVGVNLIRDNVTEANKRQIRLTTVGFYDAIVLRPAGFSHTLTTDA